IAALILKDLEVRSVRLITNNPQKISELSRLGIRIDDRIPIVVRHNTDNEGYLRAKAERMNHLLGLGDKGLVSEEMSFLQPLVDQLLVHREVAGRRPFVTLSYAQSIDGSISVRASRPFSLSCRKSLEMTHLLRSLHDALLVGINTVLVDDPQLTVRHVEGDNPTPVVLDSRLRCPEQAKLLGHPTVKPVILTTDDAADEKKQRLTERGARIFTVPKNDDGRIDLSAALELLSNLNLKTVMVEGGATVINEFLNRQFVDYCIVTVVPRIIGGVKAVDSLCTHHRTPPLSIINCQYQTLDSDLIIYGSMGRH
ncbi:MAG: dihydrofolate reductase family protein, partial [Pseudomonadota bacterium]